MDPLWVVWKIIEYFAYRHMWKEHEKQLARGEKFTIVHMFFTVLAVLFVAGTLLLVLQSCS